MTIHGPITAPGCGCDARGNGRSAPVSIDEALGRIADALDSIGDTECLPLDCASGRVLAGAVSAIDLVPRFNCAAMDGYAVETAMFRGNGPWDIDVTCRIAAGDTPGRAIDGTEAARIFTGAPLPSGADAVIAQEQVIRGSARIVVRNRPLPGANVRLAGGDMRPGQVVLEAGCRLGPRQIAAAAAAGAGTLEVRRRLRVGLVATGTEIRPPGDTRGAAGIWDVNTPMLTAALAGAEFERVEVTDAPDDPARLRDILSSLVNRVDLIVTTGGISVGEEDHVRSAMTALGAETLFQGVAIKPGKPCTFGKVRGAAWLGLPGNPLAALVTWQVFGLAVVGAMLGLRHRPCRRHVVLSRAHRHKPGRCEIRPATLIGFDAHGREVVDFGSATDSSRVAELPGADGLIFIPGETDALPKGALVEFQPFVQL